MSKRELRALLREKVINSSSTSTSRLTCLSAQSPSTSEEKITELEAALLEAQRKLKPQSGELEEVYHLTQKRLKDTEAEIENHRLHADVERQLRKFEMRNENVCSCGLMTCGSDSVPRSKSWWKRLQVLRQSWPQKQHELLEQGYLASPNSSSVTSPRPFSSATTTSSVEASGGTTTSAVTSLKEQEC